MKCKMIALLLALTIASWAQTVTQTPSATTQEQTAPTDKGKCACCEKMASSGTKAECACGAHHGQQAAGSKKAASCCSGKDGKCCGGADAKSCMRSDKDKATCCTDCGKDKTAAACCGGKCGKDCEKGCCAQNAGKTAQSCCGAEHRG
jgi:hypothetical protein